MRIAAIVVTYNRRELLLQNISALLAQTHDALDILIVDNDSTDGTAEVLTHYIDSHGILYRNTGENLGGAGGFSYGMEEAVRLGYDALWLMDDDTLPDRDALSRLVAAAESLAAPYGWLSSVALWTDGSLCRMNVQRETPYRDISEEELLGTGLVPAKMASFVSLFVPVQTVRRFGLPIGELFIWGDDWEYTRRVSREMDCFVVTDSRVVHAMKSATVVNIATDTRERLPRYRYAYRNDVLLYRREGLHGWCWVLMKYAWHSAQVVVRCTEGRRERLGIIWSSFLRGLRYYPAISYLEQTGRKAE